MSPARRERGSRLRQPEAVSSPVWDRRRIAESPACLEPSSQADPTRSCSPPARSWQLIVRTSRWLPSVSGSRALVRLRTSPLCYVSFSVHALQALESWLRHRPLESRLNRFGLHTQESRHSPSDGQACCQARGLDASQMHVAVIVPDQKVPRWLPRSIELWSVSHLARR